MLRRAADRADLLVIVAAVGPVANPTAGFRGSPRPVSSYLDSAGAQVDQLDISDGRPNETAVLGFIRRRSSGGRPFRSNEGQPGSQLQLRPPSQALGACAMREQTVRHGSSSAGLIAQTASC